MFTHPAGEEGSAVLKLKVLRPLMANVSPNGSVRFLTNYSTFQLSELPTLLFSIIVKQKTQLCYVCAVYSNQLRVATNKIVILLLFESLFQ
jgi:hypothetical protein